ncbi:MAG TPA: ferritin-like domain-containing protein [Mesorhizobium sp.]|jgi:ferritin-like metal-binding protein YciE
MAASADKNLEDLFLDTLKDIYYAEKKITKALPKMAKAASSSELATAFENHLVETQGQVDRLEQVFDLLGKPHRGKTCPAIDGILEEGSEMMEEYKGASALDAALVSAAQAVEHYEIVRYGTLCTWAEELGMTDVKTLLKATLAEEENADELLSGLATGGINTQALKAAA